MRKDQIPKGVRRDRGKWHASVTVRFGDQRRFRVKRFPYATPMRTIAEWRAATRIETLSELRRANGAGLASPASSTFAADVESYLKAVASMPSIRDRRLHMAKWAQRFGDRPRNTITAIEVRQQLETWLAADYAPASVNRRRTALMSFYAKLNGRGGYNPVREIERYPEPVEIRAHALRDLHRVLSYMPRSKTRWRLRVLLWTGIPHKQLAQLRPEHLKLKEGLIYVTARRKGRGRAGVWLPLLPAAITALRRFDREDCYTPTVAGKAQPFSASSMRQSFLRAVAKLNARRAKRKQRPLKARVYDLRHSFLTWLAHRVPDQLALQELALHADPKTTRRYVESATAARVRAAIAQASSGSL